MSMRLAAALCLALVPSLATAAPAKPVVTDQDADAAAVRGTNKAGVKELTYDDEELTGESLHPDHQPVPGRRFGTHPSLITLRMHFIPQMLKMATDV